MKHCCIRNYRDREGMLKSNIHQDRIKYLKLFLKEVKGKTIDVGCGGFMPSVLGVTHACDVYDAKKFLKSVGWKGEFKVASVTGLPYSDKEFEVAICSEVIEHLDSKEKVIKAFRELDRISKNWIVTTPSAYDRDPDHKFHFGYNDDNLFDFLPKELEILVIRKGYYFYLSNNHQKLKEMFKLNGN